MPSKCVYNFGMLLLEMDGGRHLNAANSSQAYYPSWVYERLTQQGHVGEISTTIIAEMHGLCIVGLWCIQMKSRDKSMMSDVIYMGIFADAS
jgi:hypothetical protein